MKAPRSRISRLVAARTLKGGVNKRLSRELAAYLLSERRTSELGSILRDVQADWAEAGYVEVIAASAYKLPAAVRADIQQQVRQIYPNAKRVSVTERLDPSVVGGVRLGLPDKQLDLSIEAKINKFKQLTLNGKGE